MKLAIALLLSLPATGLDVPSFVPGVFTQGDSEDGVELTLRENGTFTYTVRTADGQESTKGLWRLEDTNVLVLTSTDRPPSVATGIERPAGESGDLYTEVFAMDGSPVVLARVAVQRGPNNETYKAAWSDPTGRAIICGSSAQRVCASAKGYRTACIERESGDFSYVEFVLTDSQPRLDEWMFVWDGMELYTPYLDAPLRPRVVGAQPAVSSDAGLRAGDR